jgi:ComF family protein
MTMAPSSKTREVHCWQCDGHHYERATAIGTYENALAAAVVGLKITPKLSSRVAELLLTAFLKNNFETISLIVPVPLSKRRKIERGFNQAEVIAEVLARRTGIKIDILSLGRVQHSPIHRIGMDRKARDLSVKDAFKVARPKLIEEQDILLVDDVFTTGATVSYSAKSLKNSGARSVNVLTLARAIPEKF